MALASQQVENGWASGDPEAKLASEVLSETLAECERLLAEAERVADELRQAGEEDAARIRRDAVRASAALGDELVADAERRASTALCAAEARVREMAQAAEERLAESEALVAAWRSQRAASDTRVVELEARRSAMHDASQIAAGFAASTIRDAERWAERRRAAAEDEAVALVDTAWRAATALQEELLQEAEAESAAMLEAAHHEAQRVRRDAEESAARVERSVAAHAEAVLLGALQAGLPAAPAGPVAPASPVQPAAPGPGRWERARALGHRVLRGAGAMALLALLAMALLHFVGEPYTVRAMSMDPTLDDGHRILINKAAYRFGTPARGDVVVLDAPARATHDGWAWAVSDDPLVKRVIALPGEVVESQGGPVLIDGAPIDEPYLVPGTSTAPFEPTLVPEGAVYVLGDNRSVSVDSRAFGSVPLGSLVGRADAVIWPPGSLGAL